MTKGSGGEPFRGAHPLAPFDSLRECQRADLLKKIFPPEAQNTPVQRTFFLFFASGPYFTDEPVQELPKECVDDTDVRKECTMTPKICQEKN